MPFLFDVTGSFHKCTEDDNKYEIHRYLTCFFGSCLAEHMMYAGKVIYCVMHPLFAYCRNVGSSNIPNLLP